MKPTQPIKLSGLDIEAILTALPIAENYPTDSADQKLRNQLCCHSARGKLFSGKKDFTQNELRVIAASIFYATEYLSGRMPELEQLHPDTSAIRKHALSYVRLNTYFLPQVMELGEQN